jgi:hypothetical protein
MAYTGDAGGALQDAYGSDDESIPRASTEYYTVDGHGPNEDAWTDQLARKVQEQARELEDNADQIARHKELLRQYESRMAAAGQAGYLRGSSGSYILGERRRDCISNRRKARCNWKARKRKSRNYITISSS